MGFDARNVRDIRDDCDVLIACSLSVMPKRVLSAHTTFFLDDCDVLHECDSIATAQPE
jgi:hypothetical protein